MRLTIENIGIIDSADIKINGVTVIAGSNSSGKSTIGKVLYAIATSLAESAPLKLLKEKVISINNELKTLQKKDLNIEAYNIIEEALFIVRDMSYTLNLFETEVVSERDIKNADSNFSKKISEILESLIANMKEEDYQIVIEDEDNEFIDIDYLLINFSLDTISEIVATDIFNDETLKYLTLQKVFNSEFNSQISNITSDQSLSKVHFSEVNDNSGTIIFKDNNVDKDVSHITINREFTRPIFIDDPSIIDELSENGRQTPSSRKNSYNHKNYLINLLKNVNVSENVFSQNKNEKYINRILEEVIYGSITIDGRKSYYELPEARKGTRLSLSNLSTGMKSFSILAILKDSGILENVEYIILDEPEIHLHPEWQLKYAQLIILFSKFLNIKFLVTSHSPYFIEAIELYSKKYGMSKKVNYYKSFNTNEKNHYFIKDCTENLDLIYDELSNALFTLEELRDSIEGEEESKWMY